MPQIIINALWSDEEIAALKHGKAIVTMIDGQQVVHQAAFPRKAKVMEVVPEALNGIPQLEHISDGRKSAWTPARRRKQAERMRNRYKKQLHQVRSWPASARRKISEAMKAHHARKRAERAKQLQETTA